MTENKPHLLFVTGKLAEGALQRILGELAAKAGFAYSVAVLPITVVSLATTSWIARHLAVPPGVDRVVLPGLCLGELGPVQETAGIPVEKGPKDLRDLPEHFGRPSERGRGYGAWDIEILAEINHAPRLPHAELMATARSLHASGADFIDLGCDPGHTWTAIGDAVRALKAEGLRVSVDSFNTAEIDLAVRAGAELVLSVNSSNAAAAPDWGCEVVVIPDVAATLEGLEATVRQLQAKGVRLRIDPVLEPIGLGFAASLGRYLEVRRRYPEAELMMGVGNLTELTDVDSAGVNVVLLGFCQEIGIRSVLTTQVINWCRSAVSELDLARRLVHWAVALGMPPKRIDAGLLILRDVRLREYGDLALRELAGKIKDRNFRIFAERGELHVLSGQIQLQGQNPFELFARMQEQSSIDAAHAFYLGYEMAKAVTSLTLGKNYEQDRALSWGFLTQQEASHHA